MCLYPKLITNPKYKPNNKNGGLIPTVYDTRVLYVPIGCQECIECRKQKANEWRVRLIEDIKDNVNGIFVTLTFNEKSLQELRLKVGGRTELEKDNMVATQAVRYFLERWRKEHKKSVRHWLVTELGQNGSERIHLHGIIWTDKPSSEIKKHWQYGWIWDGYDIKGQKQNYVNAKTINYITKYITKIDEKHIGYKSIILTSAGIGKGYINTWNKEQNKYKEDGTTIDNYTAPNGYKLGLPIYYRNKIYTDEEKEKLWIEKLDKEYRWINGHKISIKTTYEEYFNMLKQARQDAIDLGYRIEDKTWKREKYERDLLKMKKKK